ncbi:MAG: (2Fe-2S) ferredoxin domain-containing protein [Oscillatoriales cyanobacterium SM2_2_1]|nr:(2Fe-2S) ferredoxin domain-containing protein [Oscillatoriales cyanobacterium SM2_2_1]
MGFADSPRYLHLETVEGRREIKLSKEVCAFLYRHVYAAGKTLTRGARLKVSGICKKEHCLKAYGLELLDDLDDSVDSPPQVLVIREVTVGICHGKKCSLGGGSSLQDLLTAAVSADPDLVGQVRVRAVGCQKGCKQAPLVMVGEDRFSRATINDIPAIMASIRQSLGVPAAAHA